MIKTSMETKVGILFFLTLMIVGAFVYLLGIFNPFASTYSINVSFNYAGGLDVGSPVRVAGVKVGRVKKIEFVTNNNNELKIMATLIIKSSVMKSIKSDSQFFVNMSGLIGEKYVEISPGVAETYYQDNSTLVGIDPPRIDQLISQSYDLFSKIESFMDHNKNNLSKTLDVINNLTTSINSLFKSASPKDKDSIRTILTNIQKLSSDFEYITSSTKSSIVPVLIDLKPTIENMKKASVDIASFSSLLGSFGKNDKKDLENSLKNVFTITQTLKELLTRTEQIMKEIENLHPEEFKTILRDTGVKVKIF